MPDPENPPSLEPSEAASPLGGTGGGEHIEKRVGGRPGLRVEHGIANAHQNHRVRGDGIQRPPPSLRQSFEGCAAILRGVTDEENKNATNADRKLAGKLLQLLIDAGY